MRKKILFLESRYDSFYGAQKSMLKLIENLDIEHFDYGIVTTKEGKLKKGLEKRGMKVDIVKLGEKANVFGGKALRYSVTQKMIAFLEIVFYNFKMANYIVKNKIDIIYVNDLRALLYSLLATKILRKETVWYIRSDVSNSLLTDIGLKSSNNIITIANGVLNNLPLEKIQKYQHKITNIYTGFNFEQYKIYKKETAKEFFSIDNKKVVIGYLGSINERKGLDILIDAYIHLSNERKDIDLVIIGDVSPGHEDFWREQLKKMEKENITFKHLLYTEDISRVYSAMDIFILPSRSEGLPRVIIEAMGHQLPVIATNVGGTREIIFNDSYGIIIKKESKKDLVNAILKLSENEEERKKIGKLGRELVLSKFTEGNFRVQINRYFKGIL